MKPRAYKGSEQYLFMSYSHMDKNIVYPIITWMQESGYRVWYDEGIEFGNEWPDDLANAITNCEQFVVLLSNNSLTSFYVNKEINFSINLKKKILPIFIEDIELNSNLSFKLSDIQAIRMYDLDDKSFTEFLRRGLSEECIEGHIKVDTVMKKSSRIVKKIKSNIQNIVISILVVLLVSILIKNYNGHESNFSGSIFVESIIEAPTITSHNNEVEVEANKSMQVQWQPGANAEYYLLELIDNTRNNSVLSNIQVKSISYIIDASYILPGHEYSLSVKSISSQMERPNPDWPSAKLNFHTKNTKQIETSGLIRSEVYMDNGYWVSGLNNNEYKFIECELDGDGKPDNIKIGSETGVNYGHKIIIFRSGSEYAFNLFPERSLDNFIGTEILYDDLYRLDSGNIIQVGCYDFDKDNEKEIIIAIGNASLALEVNIFKYDTNSEIYNEIGSFSGQTYILITEEGTIDLPFGSQGRFAEFSLVDGVVTKTSID